MNEHFSISSLQAIHEEIKAAGLDKTKTSIKAKFSSFFKLLTLLLLDIGINPQRSTCYHYIGPPRTIYQTKQHRHFCSILNLLGRKSLHNNDSTTNCYFIFSTRNTVLNLKQPNSVKHLNML